MAEDIHIKITGDNKDIKKVLKTANKLVNRFEKTHKKATSRRVQNEKKASNAIQRTEEQKNRRLIAMERRLSRRRAKQRLRLMKENIRIAKLEAKAEERIKKRSLARRRRFEARLTRGARFGAGAAVAGVAGFVLVARDIAKFDLALTRVSAQADISTKDQMKLRKSIMQTSLAYGTSRDEIVEGITAIVDKSGDLELATFLMAKMSKAAIGLGVNIGDLGLFATSLKTGLGATNEEVSQFLEILAAQADAGSITIKEFAALGPKLFGAAAAAGVKGRKGVSSFGALVQFAGRTGSPEESITAITNLLAEIPKKYKAIEKVTGKDVFKGGEQRDALEIIKEIIVSTGGSQKKLIELGFGKRAIKPVQLMAAAYRNAKTDADRFAAINSLIAAGDMATENIARKHARAAETTAIAFKKLGTAFTFMLDNSLSDSVDDVADALNKMLKDPGAMEALTEMFGAMGTAMKWVIKGAGAFHAMGAGLGLIAADLSGATRKTDQNKKLAEKLSIPISKRTKEDIQVIGDTYVALKGEIYMDPETGQTKSAEWVQENPDLGANYTRIVQADIIRRKGTSTEVKVNVSQHQ